jgi:hypothetical protein
MYAGHAAIALALKSRDPKAPIIPLTLACFGPDWVELAMMYPHRREGMAVYSHSVPAVVVGALAAGALYAMLRRPGAMMIALGWLLHWPADLLTGRKPLFTSEPLIGLDLYKLPTVDFILEGAVIVLGCALYARRFAYRGDLRRVVVVLGAALALLQGGVDLALSVMRNTDWTPSLAHVGVRPLLWCSAAGGRLGSACLLHFSLRTHSARERWRRTGPEA